MKRTTWATLMALWMLSIIPPRPGHAELLVELMRPGPWAGISGLIAYGSRLYLVNSAVFVNHNAADIYSYHPGKQTGRFERRLFSQDAGTPTIVNGLLYWPYEDPRFSTTRGEFSVTNGVAWQWRVAPQLRGFHVHAMRYHDNALYALVSAWRGRIYRSTDQGEQWTLVYEHPSPEGRVSRVTAMTAWHETLYFALTAWAEDGVKLLRQEGATVQPVPGWPSGRSLGALTAFQDQLYAVNRTADRSRLWRHDGQRTAEPITALDDYAVQALAATPETLWAVSDGPQGGLLWRSHDGLTWQQVQPFPALPIAVTVVDRQVFVGTYDTTQGGTLWGSAVPQAFTTAMSAPELPSRRQRLYAPKTREQALQQLDRALTDTAHPRYRQELLEHLLPLALSHDPAIGQALSDRLEHSYPSMPVALFGNQVHVPANRLVQWYLLYAMAQNGHGYVLPVYLTTPWTTPRNPAEKYLEPSVAAAWAVSELSQSDPQTIAALNTALSQDTLPDWAYGDMAAALYVLARHPFRYPGFHGEETAAKPPK